MQLVVCCDGEEYEATVDSPSASGTVGSLVSSWTGAAVSRISVDGRWLDKTVPVVEIGLRTGSRIVIGSPGVGSAPSSDARRNSGVFNRPPRRLSPLQAKIVDLPAPPLEPGRPNRFGWGALVVPIVLGLAMALLVHPRMAMFAIFSPAMLLANWMEDRRRHRRERSEHSESHHKALQRFGEEVAAANSEEAERRRSRAVPPAALVERAAVPHPGLWERRPEHADFMQLPVGIGCLPWHPTLRGTPSPEGQAVLDRLGRVHDVPVDVELMPGDVVGIAGPRPRRLAAARHLLLQAAVNHGPSDLAISIITERSGDWDWAKWLPHVVADDVGRRRLAGTDDEMAPVLAMLPGTDAETAVPHHIVVVDVPHLVGGDRRTIREKLRSGAGLGIAGLALAERTDDLPSLTSTILSVGDGEPWVRYPDGERRSVSPWEMSVRNARLTARGLARLDDPEADAQGRGLPGEVHLASLLDLGADLESSMRSSWNRSVAAPSTLIGVGEEGPISIDLVADGPHALLGGTTGSGKSELLRTLVAGLVVESGPAALNFVLIDYKGGSAFDACRALPHTVGVVTDLDDHLAERALMCLGAELRHREARLRVAGVSDIADFNPSGDDFLPRLLVVVDEFAALAKELPEFLEALLGIAQRGRSLGVHLLLATQRPAGVITEGIKANTNLRIALRMQDAADSVDVVGSIDAAQISRALPGRGLARLGPGDVVPFQTALVTGRSLGAAPAPIRTAPFEFAHEQTPAPMRSGLVDGPTDLDRIVDTAQRVAASLRLPLPRLPWPPPLPASLSLDELDEQGEAGTVFGLADEPHRQRQVGAEWSPSSGNMLLYGLPGSGTTTALSTIAIGLCRDNEPDRMHLYLLDFDDQQLRPLRCLPHVGAVVGGSERERQLRLLRRLADELRRRRDMVAADPAGLAGHPVVVTMLDNYAAFAGCFDSPGEATVRDLLTRLVADGPGVGMLTMITAKQPGDTPARLAALVGAKLGFRLADRYEYSVLGIPAVDPPQMAGRAFESGTGREIQVAVAHSNGLDAAIAEIAWPKPQVAPWSIDVLPQDVAVADFIGAGRISTDEWFLPVGIGDSTLSPVGLVLRDGEHALVTGPARSGKSTALMTLAAVARTASPRVRISAVIPRRSPLASSPEVNQVIAAEEISRLGETDGPHLLLVDDAELTDAASPLGSLIRERRPGIRVIAAGSADALRSLYGHWTQELRRSRAGCALRPNVVADGDLWQTPLPKRGPSRFPAGRGYLLHEGTVELVQLGRH